MIQTAELDSALKSRLHSRMIPFESYSFVDGSAVIIVTLIASKFSVSVPYSILPEEDGFSLSTPETVYSTNSISDAVGKLTLDVRKLEVKFAKWKK